ncbi:MAG: hypothetical protein JWO68_2087 [Actinomycetia bacterium]|nr:hypothetical protein [Actinomycetes bacterium]
MTINGITSATTSATGSVDRTAMRQRMDKVFNAVADKLGISADDLKTQLQSGKSLTEVAAAKGMSKDDLLATIKDAIGSDTSPGTSVDDLALRIADRKGHGHHGHHGPPPVDTTPKPGASTNELLGLNVDKEL